jgi:hypothetical protein
MRVVLLSIEQFVGFDASVNSEVEVSSGVQVEQIKLLAVLANGPHSSRLCSEVLPLPTYLGGRPETST